MADPQHLERLSKELLRQGKLVEAGWVSLRVAAVPLDAPAIQLEEMRNAFFAGAQHLFSSIMTVLDPGDEPTDQDLARIGQIQDELEAFINDYTVRNIQPKGNA